ncbi:hypothetical protein GAMM_10115 [Gammaproteobacteria bacterium]
MLKLKYNFLNMLIAIIISLIPFTSANAFRLFGNPYDLYKTRPEKIQEKINEQFNKFANVGELTWKHNGESRYYVCKIDEAKLILDIIQSSPEQQEFYFVDVGAGRFQWVDSILRFLKNNPNVPKNKKYHIIGLNVDGKDEINNDGNFIA